MGRSEAFSRIKEIGIIPALRSSHSEGAVKATAAIYAGGIPIVEISMAVPQALRVLEAVAAAHSSHILVGAGSVVDANGVRLAVEAGAQFIVTPGFSSEAVDQAVALDCAVFPGALTPSEVQLAGASGADAVKLFPCYAIGGPRYFRALRGQYPHVDLIASGGVDVESCAEYIRAGACAIGVGGEIADAESLAAGHYRLLSVRSRRMLASVRDAFALRNSSIAL